MKSRLPRDILSLVNRRSHAAGIVFAEQERRRLIVELERLQADKATLPELKRYLEERG